MVEGSPVVYEVFRLIKLGYLGYVDAWICGNRLLMARARDSQKKSEAVECYNKLEKEFSTFKASVALLDTLGVSALQ